MEILPIISIYDIMSYHFHNNIVINDCHCSFASNKSTAYDVRIKPSNIVFQSY